MILEVPRKVTGYSAKIGHSTIAEEYKGRFFRAVAARSGALVTKALSDGAFQIITTSGLSTDYRFLIATAETKEEILDDWELINQYANPVLEANGSMDIHFITKLLYEKNYQLLQDIVEDVRSLSGAELASFHNRTKFKLTGHPFAKKIQKARKTVKEGGSVDGACFKLTVFQAAHLKMGRKDPEIILTIRLGDKDLASTTRAQKGRYPVWNGGSGVIFDVPNVSELDPTLPFELQVWDKGLTSTLLCSTRSTVVTELGTIFTPNAQRKVRTTGTEIHWIGLYNKTGDRVADLQVRAEFAVARPKLQRNISLGTRSHKVPTIKKLRPRKGVRILSLDGGGIRGIVLCEVLFEIKKYCGFDFADMFDLICGTSTGGIIGLAIALEKLSTEQVKKKYKMRGPSLFAESSKLLNLLSQGYFYNVDVLKQEVGDIVGNDMLPEFMNSKAKIFVTTVNRRTKSLTLLKNYTQKSIYESYSDVGVVEAALCTSAAPLYFPPASIKGKEDQYLDGGIRANNPTQIALHEASVLWPGQPIELLLSIGTGTSTMDPHIPKSIGPLAGAQLALKQIVDIATDTEDVARVTEFTQMQNNIKNYIRLNPVGLGDYELDEIETGALKQMEERTREYLATVEDKLAFINELMAEEAPAGVSAGAAH